LFLSDDLLQWLVLLNGQLSVSEVFASDVSQQSKKTTPLNQTVSRLAITLFIFCCKKFAFINRKNTRKISYCRIFQKLSLIAKLFQKESVLKLFVIKYS